MKVLIVGLGSIATKHISALRTIFKADIEIFALRSSTNGSDFDEVINLYQLDEIVFRPDFIIISNHTNLHEKTIVELSHLGSPMMIEKPIMDSLVNSKLVKAKLEQFNIQTYCACNMRFHPAIQFLKKNLGAKNVINEVNVYCGSYLPHWRTGDDFRSSYSANANMGGGVHLDLIHEIDYTTWLFGIPREMRSLKRHASTLKINSYDFASFNLIYDNFVATITLNYYRVDAKRCLEVLFSDETWYVDLLACEIRNSKNEIIFSENFEITQTYVEQMKYFIAKIQSGNAPMNSFDESLEILKLSLYND